jgi:hypothetical protein
VTGPAGDDQLLALLGRGGPDVGCEICFEQLDFYVELELAGWDASKAVPGLLAHLEGCAACREEHQSLHLVIRRDREG